MPGPLTSLWVTVIARQPAQLRERTIIQVSDARVPTRTKLMLDATLEVLRQSNEVVNVQKVDETSWLLTVTQQQDKLPPCNGRPPENRGFPRSMNFWHVLLFITIARRYTRM